ncbi:MAG: hypothetical protein F4098_09195 [Acidimicrobiaceae bacterium]|nr:hypothetical protein [Acidimicrobiaceae bacterium]MYD06510.1 hypothetical protein [Acidimicrobiaceae bacterium]MYI58811.1 hypothetical protein [Acidimicrobiaceae bacterium]
MEALPPVSWDQLATKDDLNTLATVIGAEFTAVRGEFAEQIGEVHKEIGGLHVAIAGQTRTMVMWFVGIVVTVVGSAGAVCVTLVTQL